MSLNDAHGCAQVEARLWALARPSPRGQRPTLDRMRLLLQALDDPQEHLPAILVGGTSGKGSTCHLLAAIFDAAGYRAGLHAKPHLSSVSERMVVAGEAIDCDALHRLLDDVAPLLDRTAFAERPTWFELVVALAFRWFSLQRADPAVVEVGLGGTWDATNLLHPFVAVLTNVGLDHVDVLGHTVEEIASDKVGILKPGGHAITGVTQPSVQRIVTDRAEKAGIPLWRLGKEIALTVHQVDASGSRFDVTLPTVTYRDLSIGLLGRHQTMNAALAVAAAAALGGRGYPVREEALRTALRDCRIPGRMEVIPGNPTVVLDGAHNPQKMAALVEAIQTIYSGRRIVAVVAMRRGHDVRETLAPLTSVAQTLVLTRFGATTDWGPEQSVDPGLLRRSMPSPETATLLEMDAKDALARACELAGDDGLVVVTGSLYLVGELRPGLLGG